MEKQSEQLLLDTPQLHAIQEHCEEFHVLQTALNEAQLNSDDPNSFWSQLDYLGSIKNGKLVLPMNERFPSGHEFADISIPTIIATQIGQLVEEINNLYISRTATIEKLRSLIEQYKKLLNAIEELDTFELRPTLTPEIFEPNYPLPTTFEEFLAYAPSVFQLDRIARLAFQDHGNVFVVMRVIRDALKEIPFGSDQYWQEWEQIAEGEGIIAETPEERFQYNPEFTDALKRIHSLILSQLKELIDRANELYRKKELTPEAVTEIFEAYRQLDQVVLNLPCTDEPPIAIQQRINQLTQAQLTNDPVYHLCRGLSEYFEALSNHLAK